MNPQPNHEFLEFLQRRTPVNPFINICISTDNANAILTHLLSNQIPFAISPIDSKIKDDKVIVERKAESPNNQRVVENHLVNKVQKVYQKYIVDGIEKFPPTQEEIAAEVGLSVPIFKNYFKDLYGKPFYQLYIIKKMDYAANLLRQGLRANKVSERIGYSQTIKFNIIFKKHFGITPKRYQIAHLKK